ncbi:hypothetical protein N7470_006204 [Penicillium chermesinum]|nr:hypothetical protein N7470_006204 [Penicillium chermesinum]
MSAQSSGPARSALILYGSETGNAQEVAEELGVLTERMRFATHVAELNQSEPNALSSYTLTIFVVSTTGQGDLPANARKFWKALLLKKLPPTYLAGINFAAFGLGDSSYPKFNWAVRKLHKRLIQLGGNEIYPTGEADQQHPEGIASTAPSNGQPGLTNLDRDIRPLPDTFLGTLTDNRRITPMSHWQDVRRISFTIDESVSYVPGDMIAITPKTSPTDVQILLDLMDWNDVADSPISLYPVGNNASLPPIPCLDSYPNLTLRSLLTDYLDLKAIPRRSFFATISHYTTDELHKERLLEFTNPEYLDELWDYTSRPRRSILEVLHEFDTVKIPWQHALSVFPVIRARQFSIASGGSKKKTADGKTQFELLIAIVKYQTVIKRIREGVCTKYLSTLEVGSTLRIQLQRGGLNSSIQQLTGPTVLIGPGTGIAPLRSMLWEKAALVQAYREQNPGADVPVGKTVLLYGGRNRSADFFFEEEWDQLNTLIPLQVLTAFSRDQKSKLYVQDVLRQNFALFFQTLHDLQGSVYICGSSGRMPQAVREALIEAFQYGGAPLTGKPYTRTQAEEYLIGMEKVGRYKQETW